jgi:hypothetical protein
MDRIQKQLGQMLLDKKLVTTEQLALALEDQLVSKDFLGQILVKHRFITEVTLAKTLAEQFKLLFMSMENQYIDFQLAKQFSSSLIMESRCFPFFRDEWAVTVAITNPLDAWAIKKCEDEAGGLRVKLVMVTNSDMEQIISRYKEFMRGDISKLF